MRVPQIRLLPVTIFVAALMLTVRVNDIMRGLTDSGDAPVTVSQLLAQNTTEGEDVDAEPAAEEAKPSARPAPSRSAAPIAADLTPGEIEVLQRLQQRREDLEKRARELDMREGLLKAAETRIDEKIAEMKAIQTSIKDLLKKHDEQEEAKMRSLVKIYENMKPKDAARIFEELDMAILLDVVERMSERRVAPILAEMDPMKARSLTSELAQRRKLTEAARTGDGEG